jgi:Phosphotransferase enzyme family
MHLLLGVFGRIRSLEPPFYPKGSRRMDIPVELRRIPPRSTLEWVAESFGPGARVTAVRRLPNAWAAAVHAVDVGDDGGNRHELVLRRWVRADLPPDPGVVEHEAAALTLLASVSSLDAPGLETPVLVAADPTGARADAPSLVMTRLRGRYELAPGDIDAFVDGLVTALQAVHAAPVHPGALGDYQPWGLDDLTEPPAGWSGPDVWSHALGIARRPVPAHRPVLCHRDFHPGNVLWHHGRVSGVVDWTHACIGPAAADVAHCRLNLTLLFGLEIADDFARRYGPLDDLAWFDLVDVVGCGPVEAWRWRDAGRTDITQDTLVQSLDDFLTAAVERLS